MVNRKWCAAYARAAVICVCVTLCTGVFAQPDQNQKIIQKIDSSVAARDENLLAYTVTEQYKVYRGSDHEHTAAEMTVKTTYRKDAGKSYVILTQSGSELILKELLPRILDSERLMTQPANRAQAVLTSANYQMTVKGAETIDGRSCTVVAIVPRKNSPYLFRGAIWVDANDGSIVKLDGVASKSASVFAGASQVSRSYANIDGLPMATHAAAVAGSWLLGTTTIDIDYLDYKMTLKSAAAAVAASAPPAAAHQ